MDMENKRETCVEACGEIWGNMWGNVRKCVEKCMEATIEELKSYQVAVFQILRESSLV